MLMALSIAKRGFEDFISPEEQMVLNALLFEIAIALRAIIGPGHVIRRGEATLRAAGGTRFIIGGEATPADGFELFVG